MLIVHVHIQVKPIWVERFKQATRDNVVNSRLEEGVFSFDALQQSEDDTAFLLLERYRSVEDQQKHRETAHFQRWREAVAPMLAAPYTVVKYEELG